MPDWYILDEHDKPQPTWLIRTHPITGETEVNRPFNEWMYGSKDGGAGNRSVLQTTVPGLGDVSTVFLGLNHSWGSGPPVLFETMIFCTNPDDELDNWQYRYCSKEEAILGHAIAVLLAQGDINDEVARTLLSEIPVHD